LVANSTDLVQIVRSGAGLLPSVRGESVPPPRAGACLGPDEAGWLLQSPWFVGLISQLIDSMDRQEIDAFGRKLCQRGMAILKPPKIGGTPKMRG